jgi:signal transduction histidine kinase
MDDPAARRGALALWLSLLTAMLALAAIGLAVVEPHQSGLAATILACVAAGLAFAPIGSLVVRRRGNAVGWALLGIGAGLAFSEFTVEYGIVAATRAIALPAWEWVVLVGGAAFFLTAGMVALLLLLFPTGSLPSPRWRVVLWSGVVGVVGSTLLQVVNPVQVNLSESSAVSFQNPAGIEDLRTAISILQPIVGVLAVAAGLACIISLVVRFRRGSSDDRGRIKWLAYVAVAGVLFLFVGEVITSAAGCEACGNTVFYVFFAGISLGVPAAVGTAILRHGLFDIEVVIRKTVVVAALAVFFVLVYALIVGGIGALVHNSSNTALSFAAAAVVAILAQPVLVRARRFADLVVYGRRATPYEVLAEFSGVMGETRSNEVVLDEMARVVGEGAGAREAGVWLRLDRSLHLAAAWPGPLDEAAPAVPLVGSELPALPAEVVVPVRHEEEVLGALTLSMPASDPAGPATRKLVAALAGQAGLVLRNVQLIEELRASRRRLVAAQDEERRRLERNLHDGAQQQLIALRLRLRLAEELAHDDPATMSQTLADLGELTQSALDDLRDLARGIYPPLLADRGLAAALEAQARRSPIDVRVQSDAVARYPQEAEAAVYFCSLEALQNIAKYAEATSATVRLWQDDGMLSFAVTDDGRGFDTTQVGYGTGLQGMADRLSALGGLLAVESEPGTGTTVTGRVPVVHAEGRGPRDDEVAVTHLTPRPGPRPDRSDR